MATGERGQVASQFNRLFVAGTVAGYSDQQLLARFTAQRDEEAFTALVARHGPMVFGICRSVLGNPHLAEDAFQATFLVLVRKAGSPWVGDSLGGWLHRVAYHAALKARAAEARRRVEERRAGETAARSSSRFEPTEDLGPLLHAEIDRLPDRFRLPVVLCDLEGLSRDEAAQRLRWTEGTLRGRLARARLLLRARLGRRGIAVSTAALAFALDQVANASVTEAQLRAAASLTGGGGTKLAVRLAAEVLRATLVPRLLGAAAVALAAAGLFLTADLRADDPAESAKMQPAARRHEPPPAAAGDAAQAVEISGRVLDPAGRPFAGAKLVFYDSSTERQKTRFATERSAPVRAVSGADGRFRFRVEDVGLRFLQEQATRSHPTVVALAPGRGPDWASFTTAEGAKDLTLRLVPDDVPIEGRVLDLEGHPIAGVTVAALGVSASSEGNLDAWERDMANAKDIQRNTMISVRKHLSPIAWHNRPKAVSGTDGRFRLTGIGRERIVTLHIEGPGVVTSFGHDHARTRPGPTYQFPIYRNEPDFGTVVYYGSKFDYAAAPTRPIEGVVRDQESGRPLAGVEICSDQFAGNAVSGRDYVRAETDAGGRFRLLGMPAGAGNRIVAQPAPGQPYLGAEAGVPDGRPSEPAVVDFALKRAVLIRGRVTDKVSGGPVRAIVQYSAFSDNPDGRSLRNLHAPERLTNDDGTFEVVGLAGRGLLAVRALKDRYLKGQRIDTIAGAQRNELFPFDTMPAAFDREQYHAFVEVRPDAGAESVRYDVALDPGKSLRGTVVGPDGRPVAGAFVSGLNPTTMSPTNVILTSAEFLAESLDPKQPRPLIFYHKEQHLAGYVVVKGDETGPLTVRLQPSATLTGRLLDQDGNPHAGALVNCGIDPRPFGMWFVSSFFHRPTVDDQGRMRIEDLVPGLTYTFNLREGNRLTGRVAENLTFAPGETKDLGELRIAPTPNPQ